MDGRKSYMIFISRLFRIMEDDLDNYFTGIDHPEERIALQHASGWGISIMLTWPCNTMANV